MAADYYKGLRDYSKGSRLQEWYDLAKDELAKETVKGIAKGVGLTAGGGAAYGLWKWATGR